MKNNFNNLRLGAHDAPYYITIINIILFLRILNTIDSLLLYHIQYVPVTVILL